MFASNNHQQLSPGKTILSAVIFVTSLMVGSLVGSVESQAQSQSSQSRSAQWGSPLTNRSLAGGTLTNPQTLNSVVSNPTVSGFDGRRLPATSTTAPATGGMTSKTEPIYWGSHGLAIPYRWAGQLGNRGAKEVVLYVSQNSSARGDANWQRVSSASPQVHSFQYQAPGDGEYFFAIRTYDRFGSHQPAGPLQPEMHVIVDTTSPRNPLVSSEIREGVLTAKVVLSDSQEIDSQSLRLYVQTPNQPNWTPLQLEPLADNTVSTDQLGAVARWRLPIGANQASLRASIADKAGNRSETNANATTNTINNHYASSQSTSNLNAFATPYSLANQSRPTQEALVSKQDPFAVANQQHGHREPLSAERQANSSSRANQLGQSQSGPSPYQENLYRENLQASPSVSRLDAGYQSTTSDRSSAFLPSESNLSRSSDLLSQPSSPSQPWPVDDSRTKLLVAQQQPMPASRSNHRSPFQSASFGPSQVRNQFDQPTSNLDRKISRSVNSTSFEFDYELDETGKWGVANVELWGTTDEGNSWRRFAIDSDRLSPIHVTVPGEGDYGFKILVESVGGFEPTPPRPGDEPEVMVRVDQTPPYVMIQRAEQGQGYQADRLEIQWSAREAYPTERPIDLFYSDRAAGPWIPLATSLDNSGRYAWRIQRHLPKQVYLKIEARDEAGNVGSSITPEMISISVPQTTGSLRGIRTSNSYSH